MVFVCWKLLLNVTVLEASLLCRDESFDCHVAMNEAHFLCYICYHYYYWLGWSSQTSVIFPRKLFEHISNWSACFYLFVEWSWRCYHVLKTSWMFQSAILYHSHSAMSCIIRMYVLKSIRHRNNMCVVCSYWPSGTCMYMLMWKNTLEKLISLLFLNEQSGLQFGGMHDGAIQSE